MGKARRSSESIETPRASKDEHSEVENPISERHASPKPSNPSVADPPALTHEITRTRRRGFLAQLTLLPEVEDPGQYSHRIKWLIVSIVAFAAAAAPMGSAIFFPALVEIQTDFHASATLVNLTVAFYLFSLAIFPIWWSGFSEVFGRRSVLLLSFAAFVIFTAISAVSNSIAMLIATRILSGGAAGSIQAVGAGTLSDIWKPVERGRAMGLFYLGPLCGPTFAPIIGGALTHRWGWRATMWFLTIYGGVTLLLLLFFLPETMVESSHKSPSDKGQTPGGPVDTKIKPHDKVESRKDSTWTKILDIIIFEPVRVTSYLRFPQVLLTVYYASFTFASLYFLNISIQDSFSKAPYRFNSLVVGFLYLPAAIGYLLASLTSGRWMDRIMAREARKAGRFDEDGQPIYHPEDRMRENAWIAAIVYPVALIIYGWTVQQHVHWSVPLIATFFFGVGSMILFALVTTMLTEFMPGRSSSGVALNNLVRNICSAVGSGVTSPLIAAMGNGWLFTMIGLLALASSSVVWAMKRFGPQWRASMEGKQMR